MLRSQANRLHGIESVIGRLKRRKIELRFESKIIDAGRAFQQFEFDVATERSKEMIGLCNHGLMSEGSVAGHQILNADAAIFVFEDLLDQKQELPPDRFFERHSLGGQACLLTQNDHGAYLPGSKRLCD